MNPPPAEGGDIPLIDVLPVLGVPVRFETDTPALREAVERAFGSWRRLGEPLVPAGGTPRVRVRLAGAAGPPGPDGRSGAAAPIEVVSRPGERIAVRHGRRAAGRASVGRMTAELRVAADALGDERALRELLDTLTLFLLTRLDRQPIHGAAIAGPSAGLVLAAPSGTGKSTLAYAAMKAGLRVLTDDAVYVQLEPRTRVWGMGRPLHLPPEAAEWFPELSRTPLVTRQGGKRKRAVEPPPAAETPVIDRAGLCILEAGRGETGAEALAPEAAVDALVSGLDPGFDFFRETIPDRIRALAAGGVWRVRLGPRPDAALSTLIELLPRVRG